MSLSSIVSESYSPKEIQWSGTNPSDISIEFHIEPSSKQLIAHLKRGAHHEVIPQAHMHGLPLGEVSHYEAFVREAICRVKQEGSDYSLELCHSKRLFIEGFCAERVRALENLKSSVNQTVKDYNGDQFIYEFIQNACDSSGLNQQNEIRINFALYPDDTLVISHSGKHFSEQDIRTISDRESTENAKQEDDQKIGYKGIGFKSIFNHSNCVTILSDGYSFRFDRHAQEWGEKRNFCWELCPLYTSPNELMKKYDLDSGMVHFVIKLNIQPDKTKNYLTDVFEKNAAGIFFFLPNLTSLHFKQNDQHLTFTKTKKKSSKTQDCEVEIFELSKNEIRYGRWLRYKRNVALPDAVKETLMKDDRIPLRYKTMQTTPVSFILPFEAENKKKENLYCYLPTQVSIGLSVPVNAHFFLDSNRKALQDGDSFNEFLMTSIGKYLIHFYAYIAKHHPDSFFSILENPKKLQFDTNPGNYKSFFDKAVQEAMRTTPFLPSQAKTLLTPKVTIIDDLDFLIEFGTSEQKTKILATCPPEHSPWLNEMGASSYNWAKIKEEFPKSEYFKGDQGVSLGFQLFNYFKRLFDANKHLESDLKVFSFILSRALKLLPPSQILLPPDKVIEGLESVEVPLIHPDLLAQLNEKDREWLKKSLRIATASHRDFVTAINKKKSRVLVHSVLKSLWKNFLSNKEVDEAYKDLELPLTNSHFCASRLLYLPNELNPSFPLQKLITLDYLPEDLFPEPVSEMNKRKLYEFFCLLGIKETIDSSNAQKIVAQAKKERKAFEFLRLVYTKLFVPEQKDALNCCIEEIKKHEILVTDCGTTKNPSSCFLPSIYRPKMDLYSEPLLHERLYFASSQYVQEGESRNSWNQFLLQLGVRETVGIQVFDSLSVDDFITKFQNEQKQSKIADPNNNYITYLWQKRDFIPSNICFGGCPCRGNESRTLLGCKRTEAWKPQHVITPVIWIELFFALKGTRFLWELIQNNWDLLYEKSQEPISYTTRFSRRSQGILPFLEFYTINAVRDIEDTLHSPKETYSPSLRWLVKGVLPTPMEDFPLQEEQLNFFEFKTQISYTDCILLLKHLAKNPDDPELDTKIQEVYQHLLKNQSVDDQKDVALLSEEGTFSDPTHLVGNGIELLSFHSQAKNLLRRPKEMNLEDFRKLCDFFQIPVIEKSFLQVDKEGDTIDDSFKEQILKRLVFAYAQETKNQLQNSYEKFKESMHRIQKIQVFQVSELKVFSTIKDIKFQEPLYAWLEETQESLTLYGKDFTSFDTLKEVAYSLRSFLDLPCQIEELQRLLCTNDEQLEKHYRFKDKYDLYLAAQKLLEQLNEEVVEHAPPIVSDEESSVPPSPSQTEPTLSHKRKRSPSSDDLLSSPPKRTALQDEQTEKPRSPAREIIPDVVQKEPPQEKPSPTPKRSYSSSFSSSSYPSASSSTSYSNSKRFAADKDGKPLPIKPPTHDRGITQANKEIGLKGEEAVFAYFKEKYNSQGEEGIATRNTENKPKKTVHWMNWQREQGTPYDFEISTADKKKYIEVKSKNHDSTFGDERVWLSEYEDKQLTEQKDNYSMWIVQFNNNGKPTLKKLKNPAQKLTQGAIEKREEVITKTKIILTIPKGELTTKSEPVNKD